MITRLARYAGWAAYLSGVVAILSLVFLILFYALEAPQAAANAGQGFYFWGTLNDITGAVTMVPLLLVALAIDRTERSRAAVLSQVARAIGSVGMLGVVVFQALLIIKVMSFEQEVGPVISATAVVGVWLILVNYLGQVQAILPSRLAWLGIAVGAAQILGLVAFLAIGGSFVIQNIASNYLILTAAGLVFLVSYVGFPVWAIWLGRVLTFHSG